MALSLQEAQELREAWYKAELAVSTGQSYTIGSRILTRADARFVHEQFVRYDQVLTQMQRGRRGGVPVQRVIPRDV